MNEVKEAFILFFNNRNLTPNNQVIDEWEYIETFQLVSESIIFQPMKYYF